MDDIVELLRSHKPIADADALRAANEIERLRSALEVTQRELKKRIAELAK